MKIKEILDENRRLITIGPNAKVGAALKLLLDNRISCLPVLGDEGKIVGIISERDILRGVHGDTGCLETKAVSDVMTKDVIIAVSDDDLDYVMNVMSKNNIRHLPIMSGGNLSGIVSIRDVVKGVMHSVESENRYLKDYIGGKYEGYQ